MIEPQEVKGQRCKVLSTFSVTRTLESRGIRLVLVRSARLVVFKGKQRYGR